MLFAVANPGYSGSHIRIWKETKQSSKEDKGKKETTKRDTYYIMNEEYIMNEKYVTMEKIINDLNRKAVISNMLNPYFDQSTRPVKFCSSRRPQSRSAWRSSNGRPDRWGSVTIGVRKGLYQ